MKKLSLVMIVTAFVLFVAVQAFAGDKSMGCSKACASKGACTMGKASASGAGGNLVEALKQENSKVLFLAIDKMKDDEAAATVNKALSGIDGVTAVDVNRKKGSATVVFASDKVKTDDIIATVTSAGYTATMKTDCCKDMKKLCGDHSAEKCTKSCANDCKEKREKKSDS